MPELPRRMAIAALSLLVLATACGDDAASDAPASDPSVTATTDATTPTSGDEADADEADADEPGADAAGGPWPAAFPTDGDVARWTVEIVERLDHDPAAFTQGLEVADGVGFESTGRVGESTIRRFDPTTGEVTAQVALLPSLFGEGLTVVDGVVVQLTLDAGIALRWDAATLEAIGAIPYEGDHEGWGVCADGDTLVVTDGTETVRRVDPVDFEVISSVDVRQEGEAITLLNELECIDEMVIANIWKSDRLVVFDPASGDVAAEVDAAGLVQEMADVVAADAQNVLNGVALLDDDTLLLSGKRWPTTFRVRLVEA